MVLRGKGHVNSQLQEEEILLLGLEHVHQLENIGVLHPEAKGGKQKRVIDCNVCIFHEQERRPQLLQRS